MYVGSANKQPLSIYHLSDGVSGHWTVNPPHPPLRGTYTAPSDLLSIPDIPARRSHVFRPCTNRAKTLLQNLEYGHEGIISKNLSTFGLPPTIFRKWKNLIDFSPSRPVNFILIQGFAGCGKSRPLQRYLSDQSEYLVTVPTTHLRDDWKLALKLRDSNTWRVSTHEKALCYRSPLRVIDEIYRLPPGYLDLVCYLDSSITDIICLGDPLQGEFHSLNPASTLSTLTPEAIRLRPFFDLYCAWSYRIPQNFAAAFGVSSYSPVEGRPPYYKSRLAKNDVCLTASIPTACTLAHNSIRAQTASSSQGLTFTRPVGIFLDHNVKLMSLQTWIVAMTRSTTGVFCYGDLSILQNLPPSALPLSLLRGTSTGTLLTECAHLLEGCKVIHRPEQIKVLRGATPSSSPDELDVIIDHRNQVLSGPPLTNKIDLTFAPETKRVLLHELEEPELSDTPCSQSSPSTAAYEPVYPGADYNALKYEFHRQEHPSDLEKRLPGGDFSSQFPFLDLPFSDEASSPSLISPNHSSSRDHTLLKLSISKRLRFTKQRVSHITPADQLLGQLLFESYCDSLRIPTQPVPFDPVLFQSCISLNDYNHLTSKTKQILINTAIRSDPDWRATYVRIFTKTQHKININSLFGGWKACQTLALMHDSVVLLLGPVKKYQRAILKRQAANPLIFVYGGQSPSDLSTFCQQHFTSSYSVANDYTSFDQSQRGETVHFEKLKMLRVGIPSDLIDFHIHIKTNLRCQFGRLQPMRFTGEPGTYDDNSDFNLAVLNLEFHLLKHPVLISGDDSLISGNPSRRYSWANNSKLFKHLRWKQNFSTYGEFCGYYVSKFGAVRAPRPLLVKLALAKARDELHLVLPSYLAEFSIGHRLGDLMWMVLPPEQTLYQSAVFDFFCRHASPSLKLLLSLDEPDFSVLLQANVPLSYNAYVLMSQKQRELYYKTRRKLPQKVAAFSLNTQLPT